MEEKIIRIAIAESRKSEEWRTVPMSWKFFRDKLRAPYGIDMTREEYDLLPAKMKANVKDVGGYMGGALAGNRRISSDVTNRVLITLDADFADSDFPLRCRETFQFEYVIHSTLSHTKDNPRYRLIVPLTDTVDHGQYYAIARKIASLVNIEVFDSTTFDINRFMYWTAQLRDEKMFFEHNNTYSMLVPSYILGMYDNYRNEEEWAYKNEEAKRIKLGASTQQDPRDKKGVIGAFCRAYTMHEAIAEFLPHLYLREGDRYTYKDSTSIGGVVVYDNLFAYSHHSSSPTSNRQCNAYDFVRLSLFQKCSDKESHKKMMNLLSTYDKFKDEYAEAVLVGAYDDFNIDDADVNKTSKEDRLWMKELDLDKSGKPLSSSNNILRIFKNDKRLLNKFTFNEFDSRIYVKKGVPWRTIKRMEPIADADDAGLRLYIENVYGISAKLKVSDVKVISAMKNPFHPVKAYLGGLNWDGVRRIDTLLIDYFGAEDNIYTREAIRKPLVAAVARIYEPGTKFDTMTIFVGKQGTYKSTFIKRLGGEFFSDSITNVTTKEALEELNKAWIVEMAELSGLRKAEVQSVKHFLSKQEDSFRMSYGHYAETYKRHSVIFGTTNDDDFLTDPTGNRRFLPVKVRQQYAKYNLYTHFTQEIIDQVWAEAIHLYQAGETLVLSKEASYIAEGKQEEHTVVDERVGLVSKLLDMKLPKNWERMQLLDRIIYYQDGIEAKDAIPRQEVCIAEIWCEMLGQKREEMLPFKTRGLNSIMKSIKGWTLITSTKDFPIHGKQRYYTKIDERE